MKKMTEYIAPNCEVIDVKTESIICESPGSGGGEGIGGGTDL